MRGVRAVAQDLVARCGDHMDVIRHEVHPFPVRVHLAPLLHGLGHQRRRDVSLVGALQKVGGEVRLLHSGKRG
jgi:hypothetical protein